MKLTEIEIQSNFNKLITFIEKQYSGKRKENLLKLYNDLAIRIATAPSSSYDHLHNAFPGGYVIHVLNVIKSAAKLYSLWQDFGNNMSGYSKEELLFVALNHDLGKIGSNDHDYYIPNDSDWHVQNKGQLYKLNPKLSYMKHNDRSLYLLHQYEIPMSEVEYVSILIHDGMYESSNKSYLSSFNTEKKPRTNLPYILHQADIMAMRKEFESWYHKKDNKDKIKKEIVKKSASTQKEQAEQIFDNLLTELK